MSDLFQETLITSSDGSLISSSVLFKSRKESTNTHRNVVDDHIENLELYRIIKYKYVFTIIGYFLTLGILYILTYIFRTLILTLYCEGSRIEDASYVLIIDFNKQKYICKLIRQNYFDVNPIFMHKNVDQWRFRKNIPKESRYINKQEPGFDNGIVFYFKNLKYVYTNNMFTGLYLSLSSMTHQEIINKYNVDHAIKPNWTEYNYWLNKYGPNELSGKLKTLHWIIADHFFNVLNLYSILCILIWILNKYYIYAGWIWLLNIIVLIYSTYSSYQMSQKIYGINWEKTNIIYNNITYERSIDDEIWEYDNNIESKLSIVPGEVITIFKNSRMPFDGLIIEGNCTVDESELTGETSEVYKKQLPNTAVTLNYRETCHFLFQGTTIKQCTHDKNHSSLKVLVLNTGMNTNRANLLLNWAFPKSGNYSFHKDIKIFGWVMTWVWSISTVYSLVYTIARFLIMNSLTIILPPTWLISLTYCNHQYKSYWEWKNVQCVDRDKIIAAGKANIIVFDKTGTLTEDEFEWFGFQFTMPTTTWLRRGNRRKAWTLLTPLIGIVPGEDNENDSNDNNSEDDQEDEQKENENSKVKWSEMQLSSKILTKIHEAFWKDYTHNKANTLYSDNYRYNIIYFTECWGCCNAIDKFGDQYWGEAIDKKIFESIKWMIQIEDVVVNEEIKNIRYIMPSSWYKISEKNFFEVWEKNIEERNIKKHGKDSTQMNNTLEMKQYKILIEKIFPFSSETQSMSVITKNWLDNTYRAYIKGAPERILDTCTNESKPDDINDKIMELTRKGWRVIACCTKLWTDKMEIYCKENPIYNMKQMTFLGLVIFKNPLKKDTKKVISKLSEAKFQLIMSTGDNEFTSYHVAQETNMVNGNLPRRYIVEFHNLYKRLYIQEQVMQQNENNTITNSNTTSGKEKKGMGKTPKPAVTDSIFKQTTWNEIESQNTAEMIKKIISINKKAPWVSVSGSALSYIVTRIKIANNTNSKSKYLDPDSNSKIEIRDIANLIRQYGVIFFRMKPKNKAELIEFYKNDSKSIVIMCGDGSNDIPAWLEADIGIALNQKKNTNMQVISHFYMDNSSIQCVDTIVKTGRACFETNEMIFKVMLLYGLIKTVSILLVEKIGDPTHSPFTNKQYLFSDLFCFLIPAIASCNTPPGLVLAKEAIGTSLFNQKFVWSISMQIVIQLSFWVGWYFYWLGNVDYTIKFVNQIISDVEVLTPFSSVSFHSLLMNYTINIWFSISSYTLHFSID